MKKDITKLIKEFFNCLSQAKKFDAENDKDSVMTILHEALMKCQITYIENRANPLNQLAAIALILDEFDVKEVEIRNKISNVCVDVNVYFENNTFSLRIIKESEKFKTSTKGNWGINPVSMIKI